MVQQLREDLWREHLQLPAGAFPARPAGGWLSLWKTNAQSKLAGLKSDPPTVVAARPLPMRFSSKNKCYMKALGVKDKGLRIMDSFEAFDLVDGEW